MQYVITPKRSIDRGVVLLSKIKSFPTAFARYARGNKTANLLNNQTKSLRNLLTVLG